METNATQKWVNVGLLLGALALFVFLSNLFEFVADLTRLPLPQGWVVEPPYLVSFVLSVGGAIFTRRNAQANRFLNEVALELSKVSWPTRKETFASTGVVSVLVAIAAVLLFLLDALWGTMARGIL